MHNGLFITGTDTGCGKTEITLGLMHALQQRGETVVGMKPVASGAQPTAEGLRNEDALRIQRQGSREIPYAQINPFVYEPPVAPHLAAEASGLPIDPQVVREGFEVLSGQADRVVVEGVGGWLVPLGSTLTLADLAVRLQLPVILVVGLRLGCINHALLSAAGIRQSGARLLGWIGNQVEPAMAAREGNLRTLREMIAAPCLGVVPWMESPTAAEVAVHLDMSGL